MHSGSELYARARRRIPGGTQLLSKRPEMFLPGEWPSYYSWAKGVVVADLDGRTYIDMSICGIGACLLGFADEDVNQAVHAAVDRGSLCTLNCPEEVELADLLCELHPWAAMVRYARCGGEALAVAVRIARAYTGREVVAFCGYHGWQDWYLAANLAEDDALTGHLLPGLAPAGVPRGLTGTAFPFRYNRLDELEAIAAAHPGKLAAVVMEPLREREPEDEFLVRVREAAHRAGAVLIFDEVTSGWRLAIGGAHLNYDAAPDIAVFAKALSNGHPMAAIVGTEPVMQAAQTSFISSTYWTDRVGPAAALATIRKLRQHRVPAYLAEIGNRVKEGWAQAAQRAGLDIAVSGIAPLPRFAIQSPQAQAARTLFTQLMLESGYLATNAFYATFAHQPGHIDGYLSACEEAFRTVAKALAEGTVEAQLHGPVAHSGFARLTS